LPNKEEFKVHMLGHTTISGGMLEKLAKARRQTGFDQAFTLLEEALMSEDAGIRHWVRKTVSKVVELVKERKTKASTQRIAEALSPLVMVCVKTKEAWLRRYAVHALDELAEPLDWPSVFVFYVANRLGDPDPRIVKQAATVLYRWSQKAVPISDALRELQQAYAHPHMHVRAVVSQVLSQYYQTIGTEQPLTLHTEIPREPPGGRYSQYEILVSHRRVWALDDEPYSKLRYKGEQGFPVEPFGYHVCGVCTSQRIRLIYGHNQSGNAWREFLHEYLCEDCGKYTIYEFFD
jgi:hypothetical protein